MMEKPVIRFACLMMTFVAAVVAVHAKTYNFTRIANNNGLSENCVKSVVQDSWGFLWFGTKNGLNRYDGNSIKRYDVDDLEKGMGNHNISALYEDRDKRIWVGTDKGVYIYDPYTETFAHFDAKTEKGEGVSNWVSQIAGDKHGNIWVVAPNQGAFRYHVKSGKMRLFRTAKKNDGSQMDNTQSMLVRKNGEVWFGTNGAGMYQYNPRTDALRQVVAGRNGSSLAGKNIYALCEYGDWIIVGEHEGMLMKYNPESGELHAVDVPGVHYKIIRALAADGDELFVGTQDGLFVINGKEGTHTQIRENGIVPNGLSDNMIYSLYIDKDKGLWIGTMMSGVCYMPRRGMLFYTYLPMGTPNSLGSKRVREMQRDGNGNIWIANEEGGLNVFHPRTQTFETIPTTIYKGGSNRLALMVDGGEVWSGIFKNGLDIINVSTRAISHFTPDELGLKNEGSVYALLKDSRGNVWLGTGSGFFLKSEGMRFSKITTIPDIFVQDIAEDKNGEIWIATMGTGVFRLNPKTWRSTNYVAKEGELSSNGVSSITEDHKGNLWFSTDRGGICMYDLKARRWAAYSVKDGLPDDVAYKILEDKRHCLWFGTNQGLVQFDPANKNVRVYLNTGGYWGNQFNYKSAVATREGHFIFGGTNGIVECDPALAGTGKGRKVYITNVRLNRKEMRPEAGGALTTNILHSPKITLPYDLTELSVDVSMLDYSGAESDSYEYMLVGQGDSWTSLNGHTITYTRLPPGSYTLRVRPAGDKEGVTALQIVVEHPWWSSVWAKMVYIVLFLLSVYALLRANHHRQMKRLEEAEKTFREEKDKELLRAKISFFTDITHEIRTPLTLISGSIETIQDQQTNNPLIDKNIGAISKNCKRLLNLINQLLDFRKMDSNSVTLNFTNVNISNLLKDVISRFEPTIARMNKTISLGMEDDGIIMPVDHEAFTKIISNLLNNARKYSETFIQVEVRKAGDVMRLSVMNDGDRIPNDKAEEIFMPFAQLDNTHSVPGSGLGLPMARSLAEMHHGRLEVNTESEYNEFVLTLPLSQDNVIETGGAGSVQGQKHGLDTVVNDSLIDDYESAGTRNKEYTVLIVEDNAEVQQMVSDSLEPHYNIVTAKNGRAGLERVRSEHVDLVVSDVMMPVMDGLEMCRHIKEDIEISHIPVIMLTAKQALENKIEGLKAGADAYIEKPFSLSYLLAQIETLLSNRKRERESFVRKPYLPVQNSNINKAEEEFMRKITDLILENIQQPEFNVEQLAADMCMSRSSLHRKIKEVSNLTPIDFIRLIRLKKAAELIREKNYRSSEVCEMVGISSPSYFIKLFQKQFGMTPKEFASKKE